MNTVIIVSFVFIIFLSFVIRTIRNIFYQIFLWQLKEYRIDRFGSHLKTDQGRKLIFGPSTSLKWILLLFIVVGILFEYKFLFDVVSIDLLSFWASLGFGFIWIIEAAMSLKDLTAKRWRVPKFTLKVVFILTIILILQFSPLLFSGNIIQQLMLGPFLDKLLAPSTAFLIIIINVPSLIIKNIILLLAKRKIAKFHKLTVIGITGSYGKTSTKEFLATILSEKFKVAKTRDFNNTDIGIAGCILKDLKPEHQIFVVEMGAYKKGEIKAICDMVKPRIGIITGINQQHLELFGSLEDTKRAKYELIESLPKDGIGIFNGDNKNCVEMSKWAENIQLKTIIYDKRREITNAKVFKDNLEFIFNYQKKGYTMKANLLGEQNIENILGAIHAGFASGMNIEQIQNGVTNITSPLQTMKLVNNSGNISLVDDTFNANPDGVIAALKYMQSFKGAKILVLTPLIELGIESESIHRMLGRNATKVCDMVILTNKNFEDAIMYGAEDIGHRDRVKFIATPVIQNLFKKDFPKDSILLFEGKEAGKILHKT